MNFCDRLRNLIDERDITQKNLAAQLNLATSTLGGYVQGTSEPDFDTLILLADYFEVSTDYLLGRCENRTADTDDHLEVCRIFDSLHDNYKQIMIDEGKVLLKHSK